jgi:chaperonin GroES
MKEARMAEAVLSKVKIRPLGDRVLVKPLDKEKQERGGLIIPDTAKEKPQEGEIIAAGKGKTSDDGKLIPMDVKAGDKILYGKYSGTEIKIDGDEYLIMHQDDILGVLEPK